MSRYRPLPGDPLVGLDGHSPVHEDERVTLYEGDCLEVLAALPEASVDAIVTDPPYGIGFMGREWDTFSPERIAQRTNRRASYTAQPPDKNGKPRKNPRVAPSEQAGIYDFSTRGMRAFQAWCEQWGREALRVLRPGGHAVVFGGPRTFHRLTCGLEDAGFEVRDTPAELYSAEGVSRDFLDSLDGHQLKALYRAMNEAPVLAWLFGSGFPKSRNDSAEKLGDPTWEGWGTALKPAWEPAVLFRKPLIGTIAQNVAAHRAGLLNIDAARIGAGEGGGREGEPSAERRYDGNGSTDYAMQPGPRGGDARGRWPANVVLDEEAAALLDAQAGERVSGSRAEGVRTGLGYHGANGDGGPAITGSVGGPSRFYYTAKASRSERDAGLEDLEPTRRSDGRAALDGAGGNNPRLRTSARRNDHPTVKPVDLMRWLCRLVTPPGGVVLDPFMGSGSTGMAALDEGFRFVGIDREARYVEIARRRIAHRHLLAVETREPTPEQPAGRLF